MEWLVPGQILMGYLYLTVAHPDKIKILLEKKISSLAYEQIQNEDGSYPVLKPLSQIGGRMAAQLAAGLLQNNTGGKGVMLGGAPGVPSAEVAIIGGGTVGENAVQAFLGLGAQVTVLDLDLARLQELDARFQGRIVTLVAYPFNLARVCAYADVVVGAVRAAGGRAPIVVTRAMLRSMRPGAVLLDLSIDEGGCAETSRPTTHENPVYTEEGIRHCCIPNLPGVVARTATHAFLNAAWPFIKQIANQGLEGALAVNQPLAKSLATHQGAMREPGKALFPGTAGNES
jgi:alanine dehydrogenase